MHSEPAIESRADVRGRRRKRGNGSAAEGPVFVDNSGRRSKMLRRIGIVVGVGCVGYAVVLGMAFMGIGTSIDPTQLLPFGNSAQGGPGGGPGEQPQGGAGGQAPPSGAPSAPPPSGIPAPTASASAASTASASASTASAVADTAN